MKSRLFADLLPLLGPLVSVFGLLSCTQHSPASPDSWALPKPLLVETDARTSRFLSDSATNLISADSEIVFLGSLASFADVAMDVTSNCSSSLGLQTNVLHLKGVNTIPVRNLLPAPLWRRLDLPVGDDTKCTVKFLARNKIGSTHSFELPNLQFKNLNSLENLGIQNSETKRRLFLAERDANLKSESSTPTLYAKKAAFYDFIQDIPNNDPTSFDLICERFHNHRDAGSGQAFATIIKDLVAGDVERKSDEAQILENDNRTLFTNQRCRIVTFSTDSKTGLNNIWMTPPFQIQFSLPALKIKETAFALEPGADNHLQGKAAFTIEIANPTTITQAFRMANLMGDDLQLQNLYWKENVVHVGRAMPITRVESRIVGADRLWPDGDALVFEIAPGHKATAQVIFAQTAAWCIIGDLSFLKLVFDTRRQESEFSVGFKMKWKRELFMRRYVNWDPATANFKNQTEKLKLSKEFEAANDEDGGFFPSPLISDILHVNKITDLDFSRESSYTLCLVGNGIADTNPNTNGY